MKRLIVITLLSLSQIVIAQERKGLDVADKMVGLQTLCQEMNYNFAYFGENRAEWDSLYRLSIKKVLKCESVLEYYQILTSLVHYFHEGHSSISRPDSLDKYYGNINMSAFYADSSFYVRAIGKGFENKVKLGAKIVEINGLKTHDYFEQEVEPNSCVALHSIKQQEADRGLFWGLVKDSLYVTFVNPKGDVVSIPIKRTSGDSSSIYTQELPKLFSNKVFDYEIKKDIAYIRLGDFLTEKVSLEFEKILPKLQKCKGIIFDLRDNMGGNSNYGLAIVQHFTKDSIINLWWAQNKVNNSYYRAYALYPDMKEYNQYYADYGRFQHFEGDKVSFQNKTKGELSSIPTVILCNSGTASSSENFILSLKQLNKVTVIGENSYGSLTMPLVHSLPYGGSLYIGVQKALDENGKPYKYTQPDVYYMPTWEDRMKGNDVVKKMAFKSFFVSNIKTSKLSSFKK